MPNPLQRSLRLRSSLNIMIYSLFVNSYVSLFELHFLFIFVRSHEKGILSCHASGFFVQHNRLAVDVFFETEFA